MEWNWREERFADSVKDISQKLQTAVDVHRFTSLLGLQSCDDPKYYWVISKVKSKK